MDTETTTSLLHDFKKMVNEISDLKNKYEYILDQLNHLQLENETLKYILEDIQDGFDARLKIPHRCPICMGNSVEDVAELCQSCNSKGIVWG